MKRRLKKFWQGFKTLFIELLKKENNSEFSLDSSIAFHSLAPKTLDLKDSKIYINALYTGIEDKDVRNIALTGNYGSGKSSLIKTFLELFQEKYKSLNISLASFENDVKNENLEKQIELSIIQQIIYHVKAEKIPDSRFKRINNITKGFMWRFMIGFSLWSICAIMIYKFDYINQLNPQYWNLNLSDIDYISIILYFIFFFGIAYITKKIIRFFNNSRISKVTLKGEVNFDKVDKSVLNEYLDELLYFFERNHYDIVVIEDLDRFKNSLEIFTKLREINSLINNSEQKRNKKKIVFIYAIKDDVFAKEKDRTKFFDFIVPVIPIINKSNSSAKLRERLLDFNKNDKPTEDFIDDIALFIDDMRLLNNICNEFFIYREILNPRLSSNKLLAIIVYKNIRPEDFNVLNNGEGKLHNILSQKRTFIAEKVEKIETELSKLGSEIEKIENEKLSSIKELRAIYINTLQGMLPGFYGVYINNTTYTANKLINDEEFELLRNSASISYKFIINNNYLSQANSNKRFRDIEQNVNSGLTYEERSELIFQKLDSSKDGYYNKIIELKKEKAEVLSWTFKKIFSEVNLDSLLEDDVKNDRLIMFLLRNGYINEDYFDYVSYFHEGSITSKDNDFLQSVKSKILIPYDYQLDKTNNLLTRISLEHFKDEYVLNYDLVDCLFKNSIRNSTKVDALTDFIISNKEKGVSFIENYKDVGSEVSRFINSICKRFSDFWKFIETTSSYNDKQKDDFLTLILKHANIDDIIKIASKSNMKKYLSAKKEPLTYFTVITDFDKIKDVITKLELKFNVLEDPKIKEYNAFEFVKSNHHYLLNKRNIDFVTKKENNKIAQEKLDTQNYTTIIQSKNKSLLEYIDENISKYVDDVLLSLPDNTNESKETLISLINNPILSNDQKEALIENCVNKVDDLANVNDKDIKAILLKQFMVKVNWLNVFNYFEVLEDNKLDEVLFNYLNSESVYNTLSENKLLSISIDHEIKKKISLAIIYNNDLSLDSYSKLLDGILQKLTELKLEKIEEEKVNIIVDQRFIDLSVEYYDALRANFKDIHLNVIKNNISDFLNSYDEYEMDSDEITAILNSSNIKENQKIEYIKKIDEYTITESENLGGKVAELIAQNPYGKLNFSFISGLFNCSNSIRDRIKIFNDQAESLSINELKSLVSELPDIYSNLLVKRKQVKLEKNQLHIDFAEILKQKGIVSSVTIQKDKIKIIAKYS